MKTLIANLRHLYQRQGLWLAYVFFAGFILVSVIMATDSPVVGEGKFIGLVLLAFLVGLVAGMQQREIVAKPFAYCLPGHRQVVREFIFVVAGVTNLAGCLLFLLYPGLPWSHAPVVLCSAFFAGMVFYLGGAWLAFHSNQPMALVGLLVFVIFGGGVLRLHIFLERAIVEYPLPVILCGLLYSATMWVGLRGDDLVRRECLRPWIGFGDVFNTEKLRRFQMANGGGDLAKRLKDHPRPWVENLFIGRMSRQGAFGKARFIWGAMYVSFGMVLSGWRTFPFVIVLMTILFGYSGPMMWFMLAFMPAAMVMHSRATLYSNLLISGGRDERFASTLVSVLAAAGILTVLGGVMVLASIPLARIVPEFTYGGLRLAYHIIDVRVLYIPLVSVPLLRAIHLILYRKPILMMTALMILAYLVMIVGFGLGKSLHDTIGPQIILTSAGLFWLVFVLVLRHIAMRRCLVR